MIDIEESLATMIHIKESLCDLCFLWGIVFLVLLFMTAYSTARFAYRYCCRLTPKSFSKKQFPKVPAKIDFNDYEAQTLIVNKVNDDRTEIQNENDEDVSKLGAEYYSLSESTCVDDENGEELCSVQSVRKKKAKFINWSLVKIDDDVDKAPATSSLSNVTNKEVEDGDGEKGSYTGSVCSSSTGIPHGFGRMEYERGGRWYEGDWKRGHWHGHGKSANGCGDLYEGGFMFNSKHGHGVMKFADGRMFDGEYVNCEMVNGQMTYPDGSSYEGSWVEGMRHGDGKCIFADGSVYNGKFCNGELNGFGKMIWNDGGWYEGKWINGEMHGHGIEIRSDGSVRHDGEWIVGKPIRKKINEN